MNLFMDIHRIKTKLSPTILAQIQEATMIDMRYALDNGTILGYVNPIKTGNRVFLVKIENGDYRKVTNLPWQSMQSDPLQLCAKVMIKGQTTILKKPFQGESSKIRYLEMLKQIKIIALQTHIYI